MLSLILFHVGCTAARETRYENGSPYRDGQYAALLLATVMIALAKISVGTIYRCRRRPDERDGARVGRKGWVGEWADLVWRQLEKERGQFVPQPPPPILQESASLLDLPEFVVANPSSNHGGIHVVEPVRTEIKSTPWPSAAGPVQLSLFG